MKAEQRIKELGIDLSLKPKPVANYVPAVRVGNLVFISGHGPLKKDKTLMSGVVGRDMDEKQAYQAARLVGIAALASLKGEIGSLDKVKRVVKVLGMVNAVPDFKNHPEVINGFSDLMTEVFGEQGKHARSAVGMGSLPRTIPVEVEMIVEVEA
ncbi:MAG: RidA family protein [SAR202 cluster bacterium]|nr:RidA family protein [SAR202 cluster bacterium]